MSELASKHTEYAIGFVSCRYVDAYMKIIGGNVFQIRKVQFRHN